MFIFFGTGLMSFMCLKMRGIKLLVFNMVGFNSKDANSSCKPAKACRIKILSISKSLHLVYFEG
jgi:hypothetical protein